MRLARAARDELEARKRRMGVMTYDDLLTRLSDTLAGEGGAVAAARLRERYRVVLVDEFQDTDPVQWRIMQTAFGDGEVDARPDRRPEAGDLRVPRRRRLRLHRGGAQTAGSEATLTDELAQRPGPASTPTTRCSAGRSSGTRGSSTGTSAPRTRRPRLHGAPDPAPLRIRVVPRDTVGLTAKGYALLEPARQHVACDVAADIVALLRSGATIDGEGRVRPGHIAVLVRTNRNASRVRDALEAVDVPAVINGAGSVFGTEPAREWLRVLEAIERPSYPPRARSAALTTILGWTTEQVASANEDDWEGVHRRLHHWARVLRVKGVASLMEAITLEEGLPARVLAMVDGERRMTDLRHVGELLHAAATAEQMGATALTGWLRARVLEAARDNNDEERSRRLESDAEAVQVLTMHRSKGLEFPVVYYPDLWEPSWIPSDNNTPVTFHDADGTRTIDVGLGGPQWRGHVKQHLDEQRGEDLRLAYVALTRAKHQAVVWWAGLVLQPRLGALAAAVRARRRGERGDVRRRGADGRGGERALPRAGGPRERRAVGAGRRPCRGRATWSRRSRCRPRPSIASSTGGGGARPSATSPPAPTRRGWRASPRRPSSTTSPRRTRRRSRTTAPTRCAPCRRCSPRCRWASRSGRWSTASSSRPTSRRRISTWSWWSRSRPRRRGGGSSSASCRAWSRGCAPRSRRRWGRWRTASRCATSRAPTGSTSSTSSCRWSAATTRAARR